MMSLAAAAALQRAGYQPVLLYKEGGHSRCRSYLRILEQLLAGMSLVAVSGLVLAVMVVTVDGRISDCW